MIGIKLQTLMFLSFTSRMKNAEYTKKTRRLKDITYEFQKTFRKPLHFQRFLDREKAAFSAFLAGQSEPIELLGEKESE